MDLAEKQRVFASEYPHLFGLVYRYVRFRIGSKEEAEDVVSTIVMQAYAKLEQFDEVRGNLSQWMSGIARHAVQDYWRRRRPEVALEPLEEMLPSLAEGAERQTDHRMQVERLLAGLPHETKLLLVMRYEDDLTYEEIAIAVGREPAAVRKFFSRLHEKLRMEFREVLE